MDRQQSLSNRRSHPQMWGSHQSGYGHPSENLKVQTGRLEVRAQRRPGRLHSQPRVIARREASCDERTVVAWPPLATDAVSVWRAAVPCPAVVGNPRTSAYPAWRCPVVSHGRERAADIDG